MKNTFTIAEIVHDLEYQTKDELMSEYVALLTFHINDLTKRVEALEKK
jgi:hypothetical protein